MGLGTARRQPHRSSSNVLWLQFVGVEQFFQFVGIRVSHERERRPPRASAAAPSQLPRPATAQPRPGDVVIVFVVLVGQGHVDVRGIVQRIGEVARDVGNAVGPEHGLHGRDPRIG